jgi:hypothetical protein
MTLLRHVPRRGFGLSEMDISSLVAGVLVVLAVLAILIF